MTQYNFTEDDKKKLIDYLNFVAKNAKFKELDTKDCIEYFKLISFMQQVILPKVEANILEVIKVTENKES
jgi:hypothetical protein